MFDHQTRPHHFFVPVIQAILGGVFTHIHTWEWVGYLIWVIAGVTTAWLFFTTYKKHQLETMREENSHLADIISLDAAKTKTTVAIEKTDLTGYMYKNFSQLSIAPAQLKEFAHGVLIQGRPMTIREWTPKNKGKTFSDPQWRTLIEFMKKPDWEDRHVKFIVPINPNNEKDGFELTAAGQKWLEDTLKDSVLMPR